jgi:DNA helicase-2/ATP-dependent DNA helicase PcrA
MSDATVAAALRSPHRLVVVEAPAGCGKTYQGAVYASEVSAAIAPGRLLILAHTHAACDVFAERTARSGARVEVRTIDSLAADIAGAYPPASGVSRFDFAATARWAAEVLVQVPFVAEALARRYPVVICDEHQDANSDQHALVMALHGAGAQVRVFGDPMQLIYAAGRGADLVVDLARWTALVKAADQFERLDTPHRWRDGHEELGRWVLGARTALQAGRPLNLRQDRPPSVRVIAADNVSRASLGFQLDAPSRRLVDPVMRRQDGLLVLSPHRKTGQAIRAAFGRSFPIWEGQTRSALDDLVGNVEGAVNAVALGEAVIGFCQTVCTGFSNSAFADRLRAEIADGCTAKARGKPALIQGLARRLVDQPDHRGVGRLLSKRCRGTTVLISDQTAAARVSLA